MNFLKKLGDFIIHPTSSRTIGILAILVIAAAVPLTVFIAQKQQETRQRATGIETTACTLETYELKGCKGQFTTLDLSQYPRRIPDLDLIGNCVNEGGQISKEEGNAIWRECPPTPALFPTPTLLSAPTSSSTPYSVYGTVFYDNNGNGEYDSGDALYRGTGGNDALYLMISDNDWSSVSQNGFYTSTQKYPSGSTINLTLRNASNLPSTCSVTNSQKTIPVSSDAINWPIVCETPVSFVTPTPTLAPTSTPFPTSPPDECSYGGTDCRVSNPCVKGTCEYNIDKGNRECKYESTNVGGACEYSPNSPYQPIKFCDSSGQCVASAPTLAPGAPTLTPAQPSAVPPATTTAPGGTITSLAADVNQDGCVSLADFNEWLYAYRKDGTPRKPNYKPNIDGIDGVNLLDYNAWYTAMKSGKNLCGQ